jgi:hypothetical protein
MKNTLLLAILLFTASFSFTQEVQQVPDSLGIDSLQIQVTKLIDFYESYNDNSPESVKKAKYDDAINEISNGTASEQDKEDAYLLIDAYIKGDKAIEDNNNNPQGEGESFKDIINNTEEVKSAEAHVEQQISDFMQMPYSEYESYIEALNPMLTKREIKESYNEIHKDDRHAVAITTADDILTEDQIKVNAFLQLESATTYKEFKEAFLILDPDLTEEEMRMAWENK